MFKVNVYVSKNKLFWRCLSYYTKNFSTLFFTGPFYLFSLPIWDVVLQQKILLRMTDVSKLLTWWILVVILSSITQNQNINSEKNSPHLLYRKIHVFCIFLYMDSIIYTIALICDINTNNLFNRIIKQIISIMAILVLHETVKRWNIQE